MKHVITFWGFCFILAATLTGCYNDDDLRAELGELTGRVEQLESQVNSINSSIATMQTILSNLEKNVYVAKVESLSDGYRIYFTDGSTAEIKNGKDGAAGQNGQNGKDAPTIGVKQDTDGVYYWTLTSNGTTSWLTDDSGKKMPVSGTAPVMNVDAEGYWTVSYDGGASFERLTDAAGEPVKALQDSAFFQNVTCDDDMLHITLADGTTIDIPCSSSFYLLIADAAETEEFAFGETKTFALELNGVEDIVVTKPDEWKASVADDTLTVTAPAAEHAACAEMEGVIKLLAVNAAGLTKVASIAVLVSGDGGSEEPETAVVAFSVPTDFSECNVQRVMFNGVKVAEICLEYITSVDAQRVVAYPVDADGKTDLTKGIDTSTGGTVVWNTANNTCTMNAGAGALTTLYCNTADHVLLLAAEGAAESAEVEPDLLVDVRGAETETYKITKIGTQYWTAENLRTEFFNDGAPIPTAWSDADGAYIYLDNDRAEYRSVYGTLYSGRTIYNNADRLAPEGWTLPEGDDIAALRTYLGDTPGTKIKATSTWAYGTYSNGTNITGFNALAGWYYTPISGDQFGSVSPDVYFWTKTEGKDPLSRDMSIVYYRLYYTNSRITCDPSPTALSPSFHSQDFGHYVRCMLVR